MGWDVFRWSGRGRGSGVEWSGIGLEAQAKKDTGILGMPACREGLAGQGRAGQGRAGQGRARVEVEHGCL